MYDFVYVPQDEFEKHLPPTLGSFGLILENIKFKFVKSIRVDFVIYFLSLGGHGSFPCESLFAILPSLLWINNSLPSILL